ncbi:beta-ketoacyl-ACP synthase [Wenzhouxiangella sp. XN201]|uniref:beta-ketoacyl-ACP synthase n=1 Tax=Wenzhouxiangella sp. XN201 TaxID=2710755 RepID=UPI0013C6A77C|nr:beta-ketoacyl-ACP synthase [Wenzhouxiangella sp. XN201]NEZ02599.1 beta-ketoacyl-ACP synthase [Wenzhouxiangella sp. XN201]
MNALNISAMTLSCAAGSGLASLRKALAEGRSGLRANDYPHCSLETFIGRVDGVEEICLGGDLARFQCRNNQLAELALDQDGFRDDVARLLERHRPERIACVIGTSTAGISSTELAFRNLDESGRFRPEHVLTWVHTPHTSAAFVAAALGLEGPVQTVSTACSSSAKVFATGARLIETGWADAAVVGGVDSLCLSVLYGFHSLELVSPQPCRPFDRERRGLNLGEAAGFAIVEHDPDQSFGRLLGWGETSDAHHMASPHPEGAGAIAAMRAALDGAGLEPGAIDYINCHGTATPMNDRIEAAALRTVFGAPPPAGSTKAWTGHTLGAAGITEAVFSLLALKDGYLPASLNCTSPEAESAEFILTEGRHQAVSTVMSNSFGFGGSNCTLILGAA